MSNGIIVDISEFESMQNKGQHKILYQNLLEVRNKIDKFKFHQKVQYVLIGLVFAALGFLFEVIYK